MARIDELRSYLNNPNVRKVLDVIAQAEGTTGYDTAFGGGKIESLADHPRQLYDFTQTDGKKNKTSAAGRYQFIQGTWDDVAGKLGLTDFGPESQDIAAIELLRRNNALDAAAMGDFDTALQRSGTTWASLPSSPYAQPKRSQGFIANALDKAAAAIFPSAQAAGVPQQPTQQAQPSMAERIKRAREAGFNDEEILARIQGNADMAARIQRAKDAGFTEEEIFGRMGLSVPAQKQEQPERGFWQSVGDNIMDAGRQVGLTARYGLEGLGQAAGVVTEPLRQVVNVGARAVGLPEAMSTADLASTAANSVGLPEPRNANERVVGDIARTMAGAGGLAGASRAAANATTGLVSNVAGMMGANPTQQILGAGGAGAAGGSVREAGGGPVAQTVAAIGGGLAVPWAAGSAANVARSVGNRLQSFSPAQISDRVSNALRLGGVDVSTLPPRVRASMEQEAAQVMRRGGNLDPAAMARLADFQRVEGATPTRGMLSQDPQQITREMNLAKQQANSPIIGGNNLAQVQADNNRALVNALNDMGAAGADDAMAAGQRAIGSLERRLSGQQGRINDLYSAARDSAGRSFPLDGRAFADRAIKALDDNLVGGALPADVRNHLNRISAGEVPFTVDYAEQLKTLMGRLQRNTNDGSARYALGLVRSALDDTPVLPLGAQTGAQGARAVNPGNLPAVAGDASLGQDALQAFNQARSANRTMMRQIENTPALKALYDGNIAPDNFINKFITSPSAKTSDVVRMGRMLKSDPGAFNSVKSSLVQQLKDKALSGVPDDIGSAKFSPAAYAKALKSIGDRKLAAFFSPEEIAQLHAVDRVGRMMVNQPIGSAVNNSNTAAAAAAFVLDNMGKLGRGFKLFNVGDQISAIQAGLAQRSARNITPALTAPGLNPEINRMLPAAMGALLLSAPANAQNDQRN